MESSTKINCPKCGSTIDVQDILAHKLEEELEHKYQKLLSAEKEKLLLESLSLKQAKEELEQRKAKENELFQERLEIQLKQATKVIEDKLHRKIETEKEEQFKLLQDELNKKSEQVKELNRTRVELETIRREKDEAKEIAEAEAQKKLNEILQNEKEKIRKFEEEKNELKFKELQKQLEDQKRLTEEMKRKQEQGSMQLQGEVQEVAIEEWLVSQFPLDTIEEVKKGVRGGDCLQIVHTRHRQNCGKIYYESKRTKEFHLSWLEKFKADMREKGADIGILVTESRPTGLDRVGIIEGVWICSYEEFKGLSGVLRESVIQLSMAIISQENKGDKMHLLYDYLTSNTFRMQVEAIVEGFSAMKTALESEKRSMQKIWKEREKQIEKVISNTIDMYGSIKGIAGNAIQPVKALELGSEIEETSIE